MRPALPDFIPAEYAAEVQEDAAHEMMAAMRRVPVQVPSLGRAVATAFVGPAQRTPGRPAFVLLHGFDSSSLEFRRLLPLLHSLGDVYAVDLVGWGFTEASLFADAPDTPLGPAQKREHLGAFLRDVVGGGGPVTLLGTSLGGTVAIDFALANPGALAALVLVDAQGFIDGIGPLAQMPRFLSTLGVKVRRGRGLGGRLGGGRDHRPLAGWSSGIPNLTPPPPSSPCAAAAERVAAGAGQPDCVPRQGAICHGRRAKHRAPAHAPAGMDGGQRQLHAERRLQRELSSGAGVPADAGGVGAAGQDPGPQVRPAVHGRPPRSARLRLVGWLAGWEYGWLGCSGAGRQRAGGLAAVGTGVDLGNSHWYMRNPCHHQALGVCLPTRCADAELVWIEEAGHCSHLEQPQALADAVASFLSARSLASTPA